MNMTRGLGPKLASEPKLIYHCACKIILGKGHITQIDVAEEDSNIQVLKFYYCLVEKKSITTTTIAKPRKSTTATLKSYHLLLFGIQKSFPGNNSNASTSIF